MRANIASASGKSAVVGQNTGSSADRTDDPVRMYLREMGSVELLSREGEMCPCDFSDILEISVGGVSQHLRKLKDGGIVRDKKVGQTIFYSLVKENMELCLFQHPPQS